MIESNAGAIESQPIGFLIVAIVLLMFGSVILALPPTLQRIAQRSNNANALARHLPFSNFAFAGQFVAAARVIGLASLVLAFLCFAMWLLALRATGPI